MALEILNCGDDSFIQKYLPSDTVDLIMQQEALENISSEFYLPRLNRKTDENSNGEVEEKPVLNRRKSTSKQSVQKTNVVVVDTQLSNEEAGYLLDQDDVNTWINDTESPFDYNDEFFEQIGSVARPTPGKKAKGKRQKSVTIEENSTIDNIPGLMRLPSVVTPLEPWEQSCLDMIKKITRHEFLDLKKPNPKVFKYDFFHPVVELYPEIATEYLKKIRFVCHFFLQCYLILPLILLIF